MPRSRVHDDYSEESDADTDFESDLSYGFHVISDLEELEQARELLKPRKKLLRRPT